MFMKKISMFMFIGWSIMLVLILTFGTEVAKKISANVSTQIYEEKNKLQDIIVTETEYRIEEKCNLQFNLVPDTHDLNDLVYTSLTPEVFEIVDGDKIKGKRLENDRNIGVIQITSKSDPSFRKEVELVFVKTYPNSFEFFLCDAQHLKQTSNNVYLNTQFFLKCNLNPSASVLTEDRVSFIYDEQYFETVSKSGYEVTLKPKYLDYQIGEYFEPIKTNVQMVLNDNVVETKEIIINPILHATRFDKAMFAEYPKTHIEIAGSFYIKQRMYIELFENDQKLITPFEIETDKPDIVKVYNNGSIEFLKPGTANITVKLQNGYSITYPVTSRVKVVKPSVSSTSFNDKGELVVKLEMSGTLFLSFPSNAYSEYTYKIDDAVSLKNVDKQNQISFYGRKVGTYNLEITIDEGTEEPIVVNYVIRVIENENSYATISQGFSKFLAKILGHMSFFILQGILVIFMLHYHPSSEKWLKFFIIVISGMITAWVSEFIQFFIPGRFCSIDDVFLDLSGYCVGILIAYTFGKIIVGIKKIRKLIVGRR